MAALMIALGSGGVASAAGVTVTVPCTGTASTDSAALAAAVLSADTGGGGTITLTAGCNYSFSAPYANSGSPGDLADWYGPAALPAIAAPVVIQGNGARISRSSASGTPPFRLFFVGADPTVAATSGWATPGAGSLVLENVTLSGGLAQGGGATQGGGGLGAGGAIYSQGTTLLAAVTLSGNSARGGSGAVSGLGTGGGGIGNGIGGDADTVTSGGGFGAGFVAPAGAPVGGTGGDGLLTDGGGGGAGFGTGETGKPGGLILLGGGPGAGGGSLTGTAGDGQAGNGAKGGDGGGGGAGQALLSAGANGGSYGMGGGGGVGGGGGGVGGGGGGGTFGAGGGFGGGGGSPGGEGGFGGGGGSGGGGGGFAGGAGGSSAGGGGAGMGGAIFNQNGSLVAQNATLSANTAAGGSGGSGAGAGLGLGGAIFSLNGATALINDTIAANTADDGGAAYLVAYDASSATTTAVAALVNNILYGSVTGASAHTNDLVVGQPGTVADGAANLAVAAADASAPNIVGANSGGGSLGGTPSTANPLLGPLTGNGGPGMFTMVPSAASPALKAGTTTSAPSTDERGTTRPAAGPIDLGAVQVSVAPPAPPAPGVATGAATSVTGSTATVYGAVNPEGVAASYYFEYGTSTTYGSKTAAAQLPAGSTAVIVNSMLASLKPSTTYHYRIVATSANGTSDGTDATFTTLKSGTTGRASIAGLSVTTRPRHALVFPYRFKFSGKVRLPRGVSGAGACSGKVSIRIKRGRRTVLFGRSNVFATCGWKFSATLSNRKAVPGRGTLRVTVSFGGNRRFAPLTNRPFSLSYG